MFTLLRCERAGCAMKGPQRGEIGAATLMARSSPTLVYLRQAGGCGGPIMIGSSTIPLRQPTCM